MGGAQSELTVLGRRIKDALDGHRGAAEDIGIARSGFMEALVERSRRRWWAPTRVKLVAVLVGVLGVLGYWLLSPRRPITFDVGLESERGELYEAISHPLDALRLPFSDNSWVLLEPGGRLRVLHTTSDGALLLLEGGTAELDVKGAWRIEAGPYTTEARDAHFRVRWSPASESLNVDALEGTVDVSGGCLMAARALAPGQDITLSCRNIDQDLADLIADPTPALEVTGESPGELDLSSN